jgi:hypothetical protein
MNAMSIRRDSRAPSPEGSEGRRARTFLCRDDLYRAFEARAHELECSVDWLLGEAMKRLLADGALKAAPPPPRKPVSMPPLPPPVPQRRGGFPVSMPPLPPPPARRVTGSFVGEKAAVREVLALRLGDMRVVVDRDRFVLGRAAKDAHFAIRDPNVSRQHAIIERAPDGSWVVIDMASTNGILVNGARVTRAPIRPGDVIEIGPFAIAVERA